MPTLAACRLRLQLDALRFTGGVKDILRCSGPVFWRGNALRFELGLFAGCDLIDLSNLTSLTIEIRSLGAGGGAPDPTSTPLMGATVSSFDNTTTADNWKAGTNQQAVVEFTPEESNIAAGEQWLSIYGVTNDDPGKVITFCADKIQVCEDGSGLPTAPLPAANTFYTAAQCDARFAPIGGNGVWGGISGDITTQNDLVNGFVAKGALDGAGLTGLGGTLVGVPAGPDGDLVHINLGYGLSLDDAGNLTANNIGAYANGLLPLAPANVTYYTPAFTSYAKGDLLIASDINSFSKLGLGSTGQVFTVAAGLPVWSSSLTGVNSIIATTGNYLTLGSADSGKTVYIDNKGATAPLTLNGNTVIPAGSFGGNILCIAADNGQGGVGCYTFNHSGGTFYGASSGGTAASPTGTSAGKTLATLLGAGYGATGWTQAVGQIAIRAGTPSFTDTNQPTTVKFYTTNSNSITPREVFIIEQDGSVILDDAPAGANTSRDGIVFDTNHSSGLSVASNGNQYYSARMRWRGYGWSTTSSASRPVDWAAEVQPIQGAANPSGNWVLSAQINGGGYTPRFVIGSDGTITTGIWNAGTATINNNNIGAAYSDGVVLSNTTAATGSVQQYSPGLRFLGYGWTGSASQSSEFRIYNNVTTTGGQVDGHLNFDRQTNGSGWVTMMSLRSYSGSNDLYISGGGLQVQSGYIQTLNGAVTATKSSIHATSTDGLILSNATAATNSNPSEYSPRMRWSGFGWTGSASQGADWIAECRPVNGTTPITSKLVFSAQINSGGYTDYMTLGSDGSVVLSKFKIDSAGNFVCSNVVTSDLSAALANSQYQFTVYDNAGTAVFKIRYKDASGTVKTGTIALS